MTVKILGVCGSPRVDSNSERCTVEALNAACTIGDVETELITLANLQIKHCNGCYRCRSEATREYPCPEFDDGMTALYQKMSSADGFIFTSPVYYADVTSLMKAFFDRLVPFNTGFYNPDGEAEFKETLRFKPAGAISVGAGRNDGIEAVIYSLHRFFLYHDMIAVGSQYVRHKDIPSDILHISGLGGTFYTHQRPNAVEWDAGGMRTVKILGKKVAVMTKVLKTVRAELQNQYAIFEEKR